MSWESSTAIEARLGAIEARQAAIQARLDDLSARMAGCEQWEREAEEAVRRFPEVLRCSLGAKPETDEFAEA